MDLKEYIESGILEAYVLDALNPEEQSRVAADMAAYPEIAEEVHDIENTLFALARALSKEPPAFSRERIWERLSDNKSPKHIQTPAAPVVKTLPFTPKQYNRQISWQRAAILIALVGSLLTNFLLWSERNKEEESRIAMQQQADSLKSSQSALAVEVANMQKEKEMMAAQDMQPVLMKSMQPGHPMAATVYWRKDKGEAWLAIQKLPMPPDGMQYQMWVIQDGKPVSMGMIDNGSIASAAVSRLPMQVSSGEAFAISLEKSGGVPSPTMDQIQVLGKVPS